MGCMGSKGGAVDDGEDEKGGGMGKAEKEFKVVRLQAHSLGKPITHEFELMAMVGEGSFAAIFQVRHKESGNVYAMKSLRKQRTITSKLVRHTLTEKSILINLQHPFLVQLHYAFQNEHKLYLIMDFVNGGDLRYHLRTQKGQRFDESITRFYAAEIICALQFLHSFNIIYRDLKPANILLDAGGHVKLIDFGLSKRLDSPTSKTYTFCGTPQYVSPELVHREGFGMGLDVWSLGVVIWEMLDGGTPFFHSNVRLLYEKIKEGRLLFPSRTSKEADNLLRNLLVRDPEERLAFFKDIRKHPFFSGISWEALERKEPTPPLIPGARDLMDVTCIDPLFTNMPAADSVVDVTPEEDVVDEPRVKGGAVAAAPVDDEEARKKEAAAAALAAEDPFDEFTYIHDNDQCIARDRKDWAPSHTPSTTDPKDTHSDDIPAAAVVPSVATGESSDDDSEASIAVANQAVASDKSSSASSNDSSNEEKGPSSSDANSSDH